MKLILIKRGTTLSWGEVEWVLFKSPHQYIKIGGLSDDICEAVCVVLVWIAVLENVVMELAT